MRVDDIPFVRLVSVYRVPSAAGFLYEALRLRLEEKDTNISHKRLPTKAQHMAFFRSRPYLGWYLVQRKMGAMEYIGACYVTKAREVGIWIHPAWRGMRAGPTAVRLLRERYNGQLLAHVNPKNEKSRAMFEKLGARLLQVTYEL